jgi:hypothetical protein
MSKLDLPELMSRHPAAMQTESMRERESLSFLVAEALFLEQYSNINTTPTF